MKKYWDLFYTFAMIGAATFGGGYAMLPMLEREIVEHHHWAEEEDLINYFAIGQCTPGVIAVNTATFIGYKRAGILGGIAATAGVIAPSIVIITIIAAFLQNFASYPAVGHAFAGIRAVVTVLVMDAVIKMGKKSMKDFRAVIIFLLVLTITMFTNFSPALLVIAAGVAGAIAAPRKKANIMDGVDQSKFKGGAKK